MPADQEAFQSASEAVERALEQIGNARYWIDKDCARQAWLLLLGASYELGYYFPALEHFRDRLAAVSDSVIRYHGLSNPRSYESAHWAVAEFYLTLDVILLSHVDKTAAEEEQERAAADVFAAHPEVLALDISLMTARVRRERAKLLHTGAGKAPEAETTAQAVEPPGESLTDNEYTVLRALLDARPRRLCMVDLGVNTKIARKTCGQIATNLAARGLADYSARNRAGATITPAGERLLAVERPLTTR